MATKRLTKIEEDLENEESAVFSSWLSSQTDDQRSQVPRLEHVEDHPSLDCMLKPEDGDCKAMTEEQLELPEGAPNESIAFEMQVTPRRRQKRKKRSSRILQVLQEIDNGASLKSLGL